MVLESFFGCFGGEVWKFWSPSSDVLRWMVLSAGARIQVGDRYIYYLASLVRGSLTLAEAGRVFEILHVIRLRSLAQAFKPASEPCYKDAPSRGADSGSNRKRTNNGKNNQKT
jgi:hypothetical protein